MVIWNMLLLLLLKVWKIFFNLHNFVKFGETCHQFSFICKMLQKYLHYLVQVHTMINSIVWNKHQKENQVSGAFWIASSTLLSTFLLRESISFRIIEY